MPIKACGRPVEPTGNQVRYVTAELFGTASYMIGLGHLVEGRFDEAAAKEAFRHVVSRHEALRTGFTVGNGVVGAWVHPEPMFTFASTRLCETFEDFRAWAVPNVFRDVDVSDPGSMVRLLVAIADERWRFSVAMHHAITDGFSRSKVNEEFLKTLAGESLEDVSSYYDFNSPTEVSCSAVELLRDFPVPRRIPEDGHRATNDGSQLGHFVERDLTPESADLKALSDATESSKFAVLSALYGLGLAAFTGETRVSSYFQTDGRQVLQAPTTVVGPFSNTLPLDLSHEPDSKFSTFSKELRGRFREIVRNETAPFMKTLQESGRAPFVSINKFPSASPIVAGELIVGPREFLDRRTEYDMNLVLTEEGNRIVARLFYDADQLSRERATAFLDLQDRLFLAALGDCDAACRTIVSRARADGGVAIPATDTSLEGPSSLHDVFLSSVEQSPDAVAIVTSKASITYRELQRRAEEFACGLISEGARPDNAVAIYTKRGPEMVAAMLGVSMFGGRFAVIDAELPDDRVSEMLGVLGTRNVISTDGAWPDQLGDVALVRPKQGGELPAASSVARNPTGLSYTLFTSGTSGRPKVISHPARTLLRFVRWQASQLDTEKPVTIMLAGLSHDPIMRDVFLPLSTGGAVAIPCSDEMQKPDVLNAVAARAKVTVLHATPATARLLALNDRIDGFENCQAVFWGGDIVPPSLVANWRGIAPAAKQWNLYGTTETPQAALIAPLYEGVERKRSIPVGHPMPWTGLRMLNSNGEPVGPGELGEIVIDLADPVEGAMCLGTKEGFSHRTGDIGFWLPETGVHFTGRRDHQVKINGHRIELPEIAAIAAGVPGIQAAHCILVEGNTPELHLFVCADTDRLESAVRSALAQHLPAYMWPKAIHSLASLPLTRNGKIDEAKLARLAAEAPAVSLGAGDESPIKNEREQAIAEIYARISGQTVDHASVTLADLGADSLGTIEIRMELERLGVLLPDGWEWMSVEELAHQWNGAAQKSPRQPWSLVKLDTFILLRAAAIGMIVAHHSSTDFGFGGASTLLVVLAGYTFGLFQLPSILTDGQSGRVWALIAKIAIPLVPVSILIYLVHTVAIGRNVDVSAILFYENFSGFLKMLAGQNWVARHHISWLWFIHAYLQMFLIVGVALSFGKVRQWMIAAPSAAFPVAILIAWVISIVAMLGATVMLDDAGAAQAAVRRWPTTLLPLLLLGAFAARACTIQNRIVLGIFLVVHALLVETLLGGDEYLWLVGLPAILLVPSIILPHLISVALLLVSASALMIYLTHRPFLFGIETAFGDGFWLPAFLMALAFGVVCQNLMRPVMEKLGVNRLAQQRSPL
ncbi:MAG: AMP-binding protein [Pseudomonadota bacterium]